MAWLTPHLPTHFLKFHCYWISSIPFLFVQWTLPWQRQQTFPSVVKFLRTFAWKFFQSVVQGSSNETQIWNVDKASEKWKLSAIHRLRRVLQWHWTVRAFGEWSQRPVVAWKFGASHAALSPQHAQLGETTRELHQRQVGNCGKFCKF